jgi:hypothetical protein
MTPKRSRHDCSGTIAIVSTPVTPLARQTAQIVPKQLSRNVRIGVAPLPLAWREALPSS